MLEWIIAAICTMAVFGLFLAVMAFKERRSIEKPPIHTCANQGGCQCNRQDNLAESRGKPPSRCSNNPTP